MIKTKQSRHQQYKQNSLTKTKPTPEWLKMNIPSGQNFFKIKKSLEEKNLHTICQSARCPNISECWDRNHATFLIMGKVCSRNCLFCSVSKGTPTPLDPDEPVKILRMAKIMKLKYMVLTSVTRDDLKDYGSSHFAKVITTLKRDLPELKIEVLIPDFKGDLTLVNKILETKPEVINHNLETVKNLYPKINRKQENYQNSLNILTHIKKNQGTPKSGIMIGLGENVKEILGLFIDLRKAGVEFLTIGQYLQPTADNLLVEKFYTLEEFNQLKQMALAKGFKAVESGPFVRSSYHAGLMYDTIRHTDNESKIRNIG